MAELKTKETEASVDAFLAGVDNETRRRDALVVKEIMERVTGWQPKMWGPSIVGFGRYHYKYDSGREGDYLVTGFSPRKRSLTVYIMPGFSGFSELMERLGKYKTSVSCLYINKLEDVDLEVLEELIRGGVDCMRKRYKADIDD